MCTCFVRLFIYIVIVRWKDGNQLKTFVVKENDADQRLDKFLTKAAPLLPKSLMYRAIRQKNIKINRKRAEISTRLAVGDIIEIYLKDELFEPVSDSELFLRAPTDINIVYEDENILLVNKPVGLVVHEDEKSGVDTLINRIIHYLYDKKDYNPSEENSFVPALCNRIDRNTCGIVVCAKNAATLRVINEKIKAGELDKQYRCLVFGVPKPAEKLCKAFLRKDSEKNEVKIYPHPIDGGRTVITEYKTLATNGRMSMLNVKLHTGRTHQIRAHMAYLGHPLVGDTKYGKAKDNAGLPYKFQALCAYSLGFTFSDDGGHLAYLNNRTFVVDDIGFDLVK